MVDTGAINKAISDFLDIECVPINLGDLPFYYDPDLARKEAIERNKEIVTCTKCGVSGNYPNMIRWHFEKCKVKLKNCLHCGNIIPRQNCKDHLYKQKKYCNENCYKLSKVGKCPVIMTDEIKEKIRVANTGKKCPLEGREKMSKARFGRKWFNNGTIEIHIKNDAPEGFIPGRCRTS